MLWFYIHVHMPKAQIVLTLPTNRLLDLGVETRLSLAAQGSKEGKLLENQDSQEQSLYENTGKEFAESDQNAPKPVGVYDRPKGIRPTKVQIIIWVVMLAISALIIFRLIF